MKAEVEVLTVANLRDFFVSQRIKGNSPRTLLNSMQGIKSFCSFLVKRKYLPSNPIDSLEKPKLSKKLPEFLDEEEARELMQTVLNMKVYYKSRWHRNVAIIALFLYTGIRRRELLNLKIKDVNLERGYIRVFAKNKERMVPLNDTVKEFIEDYLKVRPERKEIDNLFVSTNRKQSALKSRGLHILFKQLKQKVSFRKKLSAQILRHTFCTLMLRNGVNLRDIQLLAGHSDISTTAKFYLGCDDKQLKKAVEKHPLSI